MCSRNIPTKEITDLLQAQMYPLEDRIIVAYKHNDSIIRMHKVSSSTRIPYINEAVNFEKIRYRVLDVEHKHLPSEEEGVISKRRYILLKLKHIDGEQE